MRVANTAVGDAERSSHPAARGKSPGSSLKTGAPTLHRAKSVRLPWGQWLRASPSEGKGELLDLRRLVAMVLHRSFRYLSLGLSLMLQFVGWRAIRVAKVFEQLTKVAWSIQKGVQFIDLLRSNFFEFFL